MAEVGSVPEARVLVVDDSAYFRATVRTVLAEIKGARLVGTATDGRAALAVMKTEPVDIVVLDIEMPIMNGLETLVAIRERHPEVCVVILAAPSSDAADQTVRALELGALDFLTKAGTGDAAQNRAELARQLTNVIRGWSLQRQPSITTQPSPPAWKPSPSNAQRSSQIPQAIRRHKEGVFVGTSLFSRVEVVAIGASAGGPHALSQVIPNLPATLGVPVLVVQHMPPVFTASFANALNGRSKLEVVEAADGMLVEPGRVLIARGGQHMLVENDGEVGGRARRVVRLSDGPPENHVRPAVDVLFRSVAECYSGNILALILSGMGEDGTRGLAALKQKGCYCLTQSAETCTVYGMPRVVERAGLSDESVPLDRIAARVAELVTPFAGLTTSQKSTQSGVPP